MASSLHTVIAIGYIVSSSKEKVTVVLPQKPFGFLKQKLPQLERKVDAGCYDKYEIKVFHINVDSDNNIVSWSLKSPNKYLEVHYFTALFADGRILADDGRLYTLWDSKSLCSEDYSSHLDYMFSGAELSGVNNIRLFTNGNYIYGTEYSEAYKYRNGWDIDDVLSKYLNGYDRYYVENFGEKV